MLGMQVLMSDSEARSCAQKDIVNIDFSTTCKNSLERDYQII
jgi:hypothetical protein